MKQIIISGKRIILRSPKTGDAEELAKQINSRDITRWTAHIPYPYKLKDANDYIINQRKKMTQETSYAFLIIDKASQIIIGGIGLHKVDKKSKKAELGYWLIKNKWGQGIVSEAVKLVLDFGFCQLKLNRIYAHCLEQNIGSRRVLEKNKFIFEGKARESEFRFGKWYNLLQFSILKKEYKR